MKFFLPPALSLPILIAMLDDSETSKDVSSSKSISSGDRVIEDRVMEKRVWRKIDMYVVPVVAMFYLLSFLVRFLSLVKFCYTVFTFVIRIGQT